MRQILDLMRSAPPNEWVCYHRGYLPMDRIMNERCRIIAGQAAAASRTGQFVLSQRRVGDFKYDYLIALV